MRENINQKKTPFLFGRRTTCYHTGEHQVNKASQVPASESSGQQVRAAYCNHGYDWSRGHSGIDGYYRYESGQGASGGYGDMAFP